MNNPWNTAYQGECFDIDYYYNSYDDIKTSVAYNEKSLKMHWLTVGIPEGRQASPDFDVTYYKNSYGDLRAVFGNDNFAFINHYLTIGKYEGRQGVEEKHPYIKGKCQMPYTGEGGGYLIGVESYDNPNQSYRYEMLILDCSLLAEDKPAWIYTTGQIAVEQGCALWTIWQPQYGYYWTLFRVYDGDGNLLDEACYGFVNAY
ncbi:MAG: hypothetical protein IJ167_10385 [Lachnospiraceae bacterium]|nr:hypothetical protein [Lachnospiraceae bacterium]